MFGVPYSPMVPSLTRCASGHTSRIENKRLNVVVMLFVCTNTACAASIIEYGADGHSPSCTTASGRNSRKIRSTNPYSRRSPSQNRSSCPDRSPESGEPLGHRRSGNRAVTSHLFHPPAPEEHVGAGDLVAPRGQVLRERPPQIAVHPGDQNPHPRPRLNRFIPPQSRRTARSRALSYRVSASHRAGGGVTPTLRAIISTRYRVRIAPAISRRGNWTSPAPSPDSHRGAYRRSGVLYCAMLHTCEHIKRLPPPKP